MGKSLFEVIEDSENIMILTRDGFAVKFMNDEVDNCLNIRSIIII